MNFRDAISQIADIRQQVARTQNFRGYRAATTACTGIIAILTAFLQSHLLPQPHQTYARQARVEYVGSDFSTSGLSASKTSASGTPASELSASEPIRFQVDLYLYLWCSAALVSMAIVGYEMWVRVRRSQSDLQRELTLGAVDQFMPSLVAGLFLTMVIVEFTIDSAWMLPGLWMILFGLGIFASRRVLPRYSSVIAGFYLLAGLGVIGMHKQAGLHAWTMGAVFGTGQIAAAALLWMVERRSMDRAIC